LQHHGDTWAPLEWVEAREFIFTYRKQGLELVSRGDDYFVGYAWIP
jgi:hypothetical protein